MAVLYLLAGGSRNDENQETPPVRKSRKERKVSKG
jgi:hypothetical protein